jgi:hypothetical protein
MFCKKKLKVEHAVNAMDADVAEQLMNHPW